jgi:hypothetical protein
MSTDICKPEPPLEQRRHNICAHLSKKKGLSFSRKLPCIKVNHTARPHFFISRYLQLGDFKISQNSHSNIAKGTVILPYGLRLCDSLLPPSNNNMCFLSVRDDAHPAATGPWRSAVLWHMHNITASSGLYCGCSNTVHPNFVMASVAHTFACGLTLSWRNKLLLSSCRINLMNTRIHNS